MASDEGALLKVLVSGGEWMSRYLCFRLNNSIQEEQEALAKQLEEKMAMVQQLSRSLMPVSLIFLFMHRRTLWLKYRREERR